MRKLVFGPLHKKISYTMTLFEKNFKVKV